MTNDTALVDRIAQAAGDPSSFVARLDGESVSRWIARAVLHVLRDVVGAPTTQIERDAVAGPWFPALASADGEVYDGVAAAVEDLGEDHDGEMTVAIVRRTAAPTHDDRYNATRLPGSYQDGDVAHCDEDSWLIDPDDASVGAEAHFAQARAMTGGLNLAAALLEMPEDSR